MSATCELTLVDQLKDFILHETSFELEEILKQNNEHYHYGLPIGYNDLHE